MAFSQLSDERLGEHALQLGGIERSCIFPCPFKRVQRWVKISRLASDIGSWSLLGRRGASEGFDFLILMSVMTSTYKLG